MIENAALLDLLAKAVGRDVDELKKLTSETQLVRDLGLDGDDFLDMIGLLASEYDCDISNFEWSRYCHSEARFAFPNNVIYRLKKVLFNKPETLEPVTLQMLAKAISSKKWPA